MKIIGLHNGHDASICAFEDGEMLYYWELERVVNKKHLCGIDYSRSPITDILFDKCLPQLCWGLEDVDYIVLGGQTEWLNTELAEIVGTNFDTKKADSKNPTNPRYNNDCNKPWGQWEAEWHGIQCKFIAVMHHVSHMALAYFTSNFKDGCLTFAYDGLGDFDTSTVAGVGIGNKLHYLVNFRHQPIPGTTNNGIGLAYSYLGRIFPFLGHDLLATAGKAMGLSSYGKPYPNDHKVYQACYKMITSWMPNMDAFWRDLLPLGFTKQICSDPMNPLCQNLMATIQECLENYVCDTIYKFSEAVPPEYRINKRNLAIAGGCALNVQANTRLLTEKVVENIYIPPATSDCGIAYGAVLYAYHHVLDMPWEPQEFHDPYKGDYLYGAPPEKVSWPFDSVFSVFVSDHFAPWLMQHYPEMNCRYIDGQDVIEFAAEKLAEGKLIAWAQGRCEIGPRALCNRSILCHPGVPGKELNIKFTDWHNGGIVTEGTMKDTINEKVKHREFWRPFAPVALWPEAQAYFDIDHEQPYMLEAPLAIGWLNKRDIWTSIAAVVHADGTCRVQTVTEKTNPLMNQLLLAFFRNTGIPVLLNTSLNDAGKPIANTIEDILNLLRDSELDYAIIGNWVFSKKS